MIQQLVITVLFDLENTWKHGILKDLHGMDLREGRGIYLNSYEISHKTDIFRYEKDRFCLILMNNKWNFHRVTLISININGIAKVLHDDLLMTLASATGLNILPTLNVNFNYSKWSLEISKTQCMHF